MFDFFFCQFVFEFNTHMCETIVFPMWQNNWSQRSFFASEQYFCLSYTLCLIFSPPQNSSFLKYLLKLHLIYSPEDVAPEISPLITPSSKENREVGSGFSRVILSRTRMSSVSVILSYRR